MNVTSNPIEMKIAEKEAYSLKGSSTGMKFIGSTEDKTGRVSIYYKDAENQYWYETRFREADKMISEEEYIFGRKLIKRQRKYVV